MFDLILADPPWKNSAPAKKVKDGSGRAEGHSADIYAGMTNQQIADLPVSAVASKDAYLFLWVDAQHHHVAVDIAMAWGFPQFATKLTWLKTNEKLEPVGGIGRYTMVWAEDCWIFKRGKPAFVYTPVQNPFTAPRGRHSRKPDWLYKFIEMNHSKGKVRSSWPKRRLELFARTHHKGEKLWEPRNGWVQLGNEFEGPVGLGEDITVGINRILRRPE